jgi:hypothetical protein
MPPLANFQFVRARVHCRCRQCVYPSFRCWRGRRLCGNSHSTVLQDNHSRITSDGRVALPFISYYTREIHAKSVPWLLLKSQNGSHYTTPLIRTRFRSRCRRWSFLSQGAGRCASCIGLSPRLLMVHADVRHVMTQSAARTAKQLAEYLAGLLKQLALGGAEIASTPAFSRK